MQDSLLRERALDTSRSFIVQAPAGSGKTELLTNRYLALLAKATHPENVLALTFTNKAVSELRSRIMHSLIQANANTPPKEPHKYQNYLLAQQVLQRSTLLKWDLLYHQSRISVTTFDGLAYKVARHYTHENDIRTVQLLEHREGVYEESVIRVLQNLAQHEAKESILEVLKYFHNNARSVISLCATMLESRTKWIHTLYDTRLNQTTLQQSIDALLEQELCTLQELARDNLSLNFFDLSKINPGCELRAYPQSITDFKTLAQLCLTQSGTPKKQLKASDGFTNTTPEQNKQFIAHLQSFSSAFITALGRIHLLPNEVNFEHIEHISKMLFACNYELGVVFEERGGVDYDEIMIRANSLLSREENIANIALYMDAQVEHILIDEFQDTSFTQLEFITHMTQSWEQDDGRTLFLVGDPMQSIYLFRGAQVGVFLHAKEHGIGTKILENIVLRSNFRSSLKIVQHTNDVCNRMFPTTYNYNEGKISYEASQAMRSDEGKVLFTPFTKGQEQDELEYIATTIKAINDAHPEYSIAILGRTSKHFNAISKTLQHHNIALSSYKTSKLSEEPLVIDLLSICRVLLNAQDKFAWLSILRSPYIGVELSTLLRFSESDDVFASLLTEYFGSAQVETELKRVHHVFSNAYSYMAHLGMSNTCSHLVKALYIDATLDTRGLEILNEFITTLDTLELQGNLTISALEETLGEVYSPSTPSQVSLLTIHKAKGLEFDVVFMSHLNAQPKAEESQLLYINEFVDIGMLLGVKAGVFANEGIYEFLKENHKNRVHYESMRVLYVALTRAKKELYMSACVNTQSKSLFASRSFMQLLAPYYAQYYEGLQTLNHITTTDIISHMRHDMSGIEYPHTISIAKNEHNVSFTLSDHIYSGLGSIIHECLEHEEYTPHEGFLSALCTKYHLPAHHRHTYIQMCQEILHTVRNSEHFDFLFKERQSTLRECAVMYDGRTFIIDKVFTEGEYTYIIDFKTVFSKILEPSVLDAYTQQLHNYVAALKSIYNNTKATTHAELYIQPNIKTALFITTTGELIYV